MVSWSGVEEWAGSTTKPTKPGMVGHGKQLRIHYKCSEKPLEISKRIADHDLTKQCSLKITLAIIVMNGLKEVRIGEKKKNSIRLLG